MRSKIPGKLFLSAENIVVTNWMFSNGGVRSGPAARPQTAYLTLPSAMVHVRIEPAAWISGLRGAAAIEWRTYLLQASSCEGLATVVVSSMSTRADPDHKRNQDVVLGSSFRIVFCIAILLDCTRFNLEF